MSDQISQDKPAGRGAAITGLVFAVASAVWVLFILGTGGGGGGKDAAIMVIVGSLMPLPGVVMAIVGRRAKKLAMSALALSGICIIIYAYVWIRFGSEMIRSL